MILLTLNEDVKWEHIEWKEMESYEVNVLNDDWNLFVPRTVSGLIPTSNIDGVVNKPPPPAIESIKDATREIPKRNKYTVLVSCEISIKNS